MRICFNPVNVYGRIKVSLENILIQIFIENIARANLLHPLIYGNYYRICHIDYLHQENLKRLILILGQTTMFECWKQTILQIICDSMTAHFSHDYYTDERRSVVYIKGILEITIVSPVRHQIGTRYL